MANQTTFLTTLAHAKIDCDVADDDNDNRNNVLDQRLETFWQPDLSSNQAIRFGLNVTNGINITHFGIWVSNYDSLVGDIDITITESDTDGSGYSTIGTPTNITFGIGGLYFVELDTAGSKRYLRITFGSTNPSSPYPEISGIFFLTERTITARPEFPMTSVPKHFNKTYDAGGGQQYVTAEALNYIVEFVRNFKVISAADNTTLENIFINSPLTAFFKSAGCKFLLTNSLCKSSKFLNSDALVVRCTRKGILLNALSHLSVCGHEKVKLFI